MVILQNFKEILDVHIERLDDPCFHDLISFSNTDNDLTWSLFISPFLIDDGCRLFRFEIMGSIPRRYKHLKKGLTRQFALRHEPHMYIALANYIDFLLRLKTCACGRATFDAICLNCHMTSRELPDECPICLARMLDNPDLTHTTPCCDKKVHMYCYLRIKDDRCFNCRRIS